MKPANELSLFGDVLKTFGTTGELIVKLRNDVPQEIIQKKEPVFVYIDGLPVPFYILTIESKGTSKLLMVFEDMETEALAAELVGKQVYYSSKLGTKASADDGLSVFIGFTVITVGEGVLGIVKDVMDIPGNPCLVVDGENGSELIVPFNEDLLVKVNVKGKELHLNLPEGLLDL